MSGTGHSGESKLGETGHGTFIKGTEIQEFYRDCNVLITGGTGFLGKLLIEKLLRSCPANKKIFILIRPKRGKSAEERKEKLFKCVIFDSLKAANPSFHEKIVMVSGDISLAKLGFSPVDYEMLTRQVNIILHLAATVKFDEKVNIAVPINITGTKEIINLGRECVNLKSIVYASTAYSNCHLKDIKESFYTPPLEEDETINYLTTVDEVIMELIMPKVLGEWPNTYTFTKAIAENILRKTASDLPISIVRPSQITGTLKEPLVGWIDNFYGPNGLVAGVGMGLLKTFFNKGELKSEIIPGDLVINGIIVAAYDVGVRRYEEIPIYHNVSGRHAISNIDSEKIIYKRISEVPMKQAIWYPWKINFESWFWFRFATIFLHVIPGAIIDLVLMFQGKTPMLVKIYRKVDKHIHLLKYFSMYECNFDNQKCLSLYNSLGEKDKEIFYFNSNEIVWKDYLTRLVDGGRLYMLKESVDTIPEGKIRYMKFYIAHQTIKVLLYGLIAWILWSVVLRVKYMYFS